MPRVFAVVLLAASALVLQPSVASAHCDALDGPVVTAARSALDKNDVTPVLRWVPAEREADVRAAFARTIAVRGLGAEARVLADTWFFETIVRIHRAAEGAPFEGLKPAGHTEPFITAVDNSLASGSADDLVTMATAHAAQGLRERFTRAHEAKAHADESVEAGRRYVAAYVEYMHYVEGLHRAIGAAPGPHETEHRH